MLFHVVASGRVAVEIFHAAAACGLEVVEFVHVVVVFCHVVVVVVASGHVAWAVVIVHAGKENGHAVD